MKAVRKFISPECKVFAGSPILTMDGRHQPQPLMTKAEVIKFVTKKPFDKYDNYDAIEVPLVKNIRAIIGV